MLEEEKSWWKSKGFYTCACVLLLGVMAVGAIAFRNVKVKNSEKMLAEIEKEIPDTVNVPKNREEEEDSVAASAKVTPVPTQNVAKQKEKEEKQKQKQAQEEKKKEEQEREERAKIAARKEAAAVAAKVQHSFSEEKGLLWPVTGEILMKYSMDKTIYFKTLAQYKYNPGLLIQAAVGTEVKAAADGKVLEVKNDDDYGTIVKMDLGNNYRVTYGQITEVQVKVGEEVSEGDVIAKIAAPTKYYSEEGSHLYLQVMQGEQSVDPMLLLR